MGWEAAYLAQIDKQRNAELKILRWYRIMLNVVLQLGRASPVIAAMLTCVTYALLGTLNIAVVMPMISIFQSLRVPFIMLPMVVQLIVMLMVTVHRVEAYLALPDAPASSATEDGTLLTIDNLDLAPVEVAVTPDSLPSGVNSIDIRVDADISGLFYEGSAGVFGDLDGDGRVCGSDLTVLLSQWGSGGGSADLDGDGFVGGPDLTTLLAFWDC